MLNYRSKFKKDLELLKQKSEDKHTLDYYCDDEAVREILEAYENEDSEFLTEMEELEKRIIASPKPLWEL